MKLIPIAIIAILLLTGAFTSCKKDPVSPKPCDTCNKPCDTCNINQDSLQRIKDSLAHAFIWKEFTIPSETNLTGVWVFGPNDIMICGNSLWHFDGTSFTLIDENYTRHPTISLNGALNGNHIFALSQTDFWLVDGIAFHSTDTHHLDDMRPPINIHACWGTSSNDMFFVGDGGKIYHYNGTKFDSMNSNSTKDIGQIWGTDNNNIWASGWNQTTAESVLLHYDGNSWTIQDLSKLGDIGLGKNALIGVWTCDSANRHITVASGSFIYRTTDNGLWRSDTLKNSLGGGAYDGLNVTRGNNATDFMVQGGGGFLSHWNGKTWYFYKDLFDWNNPNYDIGAFSYSGNTACMVGFKNGSSFMVVGTRKQ